MVLTYNLFYPLILYRVGKKPKYFPTVFQRPNGNEMRMYTEILEFFFQNWANLFQFESYEVCRLFNNPVIHHFETLRSKNNPYFSKTPGRGQGNIVRFL